MDPITISAASGLRARMDSLDMLANNLANESASGYKADREFYSLYVAPEASGSVPDADTQPVIERPWTDFSQGEPRATGNPLDVALSGKGFFTVAGPHGPLYTRNGGFRVSAAGAMVGAEDYPLQIVGGGPLVVDPARPVQIGADGTVSQDGSAVGQLAVVDFSNPGALAKQGQSYFHMTDPSVLPAAAADFELRPGMLENSNASSAQGAARLVSLMRQFEMLKKAATLGDEMNRQALEQVAKP
jgi:flagellar basal body rod protein FlgG